MTTEKEIRDHLIAKASGDERFRQELISDPKGVLRDIGVSVPDSISLHVHEEKSQAFHLVLPVTDRLSETELEATAGGGVYTDQNRRNLRSQLINLG